MNRLLALAFAAALAFVQPALAQNPLVPLVQEVHPDDVVQIIPHAIPRADSVFATVQQLNPAFGSIPDRTVLGNVSGVAAPPVPLNTTQLTTLIDTFTVTTSGAVPAPVTLNNFFLRDDGVFAAAPGSGTVTSVIIAPGTLISVSGTCTITTSGTCTVGVANGAANTVITGTGGASVYSATPTLGTNSGTGGQITLNGSTSGSSVVRVGAAAGTGSIFQLPATNGSSGQFLQTNGSGVTSWQDVTGLACTLASVTDWLGNVTGKCLTTDAVWGGAAVSSLGSVSSGSITPNFCTHGNYTVTLAGTGLTLANPSCINDGQTFTIYLVQDSGGSRTITTYGSYYKFGGGTAPTLTTTGSAFDLLQCTTRAGAATGVCVVINNPS